MGRKYQTEDEVFEAAVARRLIRMHELGADVDPVALDHGDRFIATIENRRSALVYASALCSFFGWCRAARMAPFRMKPSDAKLYRASLAKLAPKTARVYISGVRGFYLSAIDDELTAVDPFARVKLPKPVVKRPPAAFTAEEFDAILRPMWLRIVGGNASPTDERDYTMIYLLGRIGPRNISVRRARWGDWFARGERGEANLFQKGGELMPFDLPPDVQSAISAWRRTLTSLAGRSLRWDDPMFPSIGSTQSFGPDRQGRTLPALTSRGILGIVQARCRDALLDMPGICTHAFRVSAATIAHEHGARDEQIQRTLGHSDPRSTQGYIRRKHYDNAANTWTPRYRRIDVEQGEPGRKDAA